MISCYVWRECWINAFICFPFISIYVLLPDQANEKECGHCRHKFHGCTKRRFTFSFTMNDIFKGVIFVVIVCQERYSLFLPLPGLDNDASHYCQSNNYTTDGACHKDDMHWAMHIIFLDLAKILYWQDNDRNRNHQEDQSYGNSVEIYTHFGPATFPTGTVKRYIEHVNYQNGLH